LLNTIVNFGIFGLRVPVFGFRISGKPDPESEPDPPDVASNYPVSDPVEKTTSGTPLYLRSDTKSGSSSTSILAVHDAIVHVAA